MLSVFWVSGTVITAWVYEKRQRKEDLQEEDRPVMIDSL